MTASRKALEISVACAGRLEARVECVLEALAARGHSATLHTGASAREALLGADARSLRVLLLVDRLDPAQLETLERGLDPDRRGDLLVTTIDRSAPEMADRIEAFARVAQQTKALRFRKRARSVKLPDPVVRPNKPHSFAVPLAIAAVLAGGLLVALQYGLRRDAKHDVADPGVADAAAIPESTSPAAVSGDAPNDPIQVSVQPADEGIEIFEIEGTRGRPKRARKVAAPTSTAPDAAPPTAKTTGPIADAPALGATPLLAPAAGPGHTPGAAKLVPPGEELDLE